MNVFRKFVIVQILVTITQILIAVALVFKPSMVLFLMATLLVLYFNEGYLSGLVKGPINFRFKEIIWNHACETGSNINFWWLANFIANIASVGAISVILTSKNLQLVTLIKITGGVFLYVTLIGVIIALGDYVGRMRQETKGVEMLPKFYKRIIHSY